MKTKQLSPLEAWKELKQLVKEYERAVKFSSFDIVVANRSLFPIIETALKRLERLEKSYKQATDMKCDMERIINRDSKKLKALEIIKEKKVDCNTLMFYLKKHNETGHINYAFDSYNDYAKESDKPQLTKEEYDLLKEMLL